MNISEIVINVLGKMKIKIICPNPLLTLNSVVYSIEIIKLMNFRLR